MRKRIGAAIVAAALVLSLLSTAALAADTTLTVRTPATIPKAGEEFTVTVEITGNPGINTVDLALSYDKSAVSCESVELGSVTTGALSASNPDADGSAKLSLVSLQELSGDGTIMVCSFRSLNGGNAGLELTGYRLTNDDNLISCTIATGTLTDSEPVESAPVTSEEGNSSSPVSSTTEFSSGNTEQESAEQSASSSGSTEELVATPTFSDAAGHWGEAWIVEAAERGLFSGDDKGNFRPDENISRGDYVLVLWRMAGKPEPKNPAPFADVPEKSYYATAIAWAAEQGYVNGKGDGFAPKDSLTRQEAMKILFGYAGGVSGMELMLSGVYDSAFSDSNEIAGWAKSAMYWAVYNRIINGMNGGLNPKGEATRVQLAKILVEYQKSMEPTNNET